MSKRRRRRQKTSALTGWILLILAFAAVIAFGGLGYAVWDFLHSEERQQQASAAREEAISDTTAAEPLETGTPADEVLKIYMERLNNGDYKGMYSLLDRESRVRVPIENYLERHERIYKGIRAKNITCSITDEGTDSETKKGDPVSLLYTQTMDTVAGTITFDNSVTLNRDSDGYKISWHDSLIFPDLTETGSVRVSTDLPKRGRILDRYGRVLAGSGTAVSVGVVPGELEDDSVARLAEELEMTEEAIRNKLSASWVTDETLVPIKTVEKLTNEELYSDLQTDKIAKKQLRDKHLAQIPGVTMEDVEVRYYPMGEITSHLIGYLQGITNDELEADSDGAYSSNSLVGKVGLESLFETRLRGMPGRKLRVLSENGDVLKVLAETQPVDGEDVTTTIDLELQKKIYGIYQNDKTASVAMNPYTGEVLALVSTPAYDDNLFILGLTTDQWNLLNDDPANPLVNRFRAVWTPGSSFKPIVGAIGMSSGALDPDENLGSEKEWQRDESWGSYYVTTLHAASPAKLSNALVASDNVYFAKAACLIGAEHLESALDGLGFGGRIPFEIQMSISSYATGSHIESDIQLADSGYGQGSIQVNPLHLGLIYTAFLNEGNMVRPHLELHEDSAAAEEYAAQEMLDADENDPFEEEEEETEEEETEEYVDPWPELATQSAESALVMDAKYWRKRVFSPEACELVNDALTRAVDSSSGTGHGARVSGLKIAGKTGTAEIKESKDDLAGTELGWFAAYTPDTEEEDSLLLVTMVEDVKDRGGSGYVTQRNGDIFRYYCKEAPPSEDRSLLNDELETPMAEEDDD